MCRGKHWTLRSSPSTPRQAARGIGFIIRRKQCLETPAAAVVRPEPSSDGRYVIEVGTMRRDLSRLHLGHIPGHHLAAPDVDHQVGSQPHPPHRDRQKADIPAPNPVLANRHQARHGARFLRQPGPTQAVALTRLVQHPIEAVLGADIEALIVPALARFAPEAARRTPAGCMSAESAGALPL